MSNTNTKDWFTRISGLFLVLLMSAFFVRGCFITKVPAGETGVRNANWGGLEEEDLLPGYHLEVIGYHRVWNLPSKYLFLNYTNDKRFTIRTKDNNTVMVDVSIPYRIKPGHTWEVMKDGNQVMVDGETYRFERFAHRVATDVLNAVLSELSSSDFYVTETRLEVAEEALVRLNKGLEKYHLEADKVLIRQYVFRPKYEAQLAAIQLNEQVKLLDDAKSKVADKQQILDNYEQETEALVSAKEQDWARKLADLNRAFEVGLVPTKGDETPGAARRILSSLPESEKSALVTQAAKTFGKKEEDIRDEHLLGIKNIQAETKEYFDRVTSESEGVQKRLEAEGRAKVAVVQGDYDAAVNKMLDSPAGRAYVAYEAADNFKFDGKLDFRSSDGIPSVLRLRDFAEKFMGIR